MFPHGLVMPSLSCTSGHNSSLLTYVISSNKTCHVHIYQLHAVTQACTNIEIPATHMAERIW